MPPSGFDAEAVDGILRFVRANFKALKKEVESGKHESFDVAIEYEISQIGKALLKIHINKEGKLVER